MADSFESHPFENIFEIEQGTTLIPKPDLPIATVQTFDLYDNKDREIEEQYETIYNAAFNAFIVQSTSGERGGDPRFASSNAEVANQFLTTALNAVKEKADLKYKKEKNNGGSTKNITNNNLIIDRNELLKQLAGLNSKE